MNVSQVRNKLGIKSKNSFEALQHDNDKGDNGKEEERQDKEERNNKVDGK